MGYAVGVGVYFVGYALAAILPLLFVSGGQAILVVIYSVPILLVGPRVSQRFTDGSPLVPQGFRNQGGFLFAGGLALIWIGHLAFFGAIAAAIYLSVQGTAGVPVGIVAGLAFFPYLLGIVLVEIAFRSWSSRQPEQAWKAKRNRVFVIVGLIILAHLAIVIGRAVTTGRGPDLLSYYEREALARGRGYAREVQRVAERFYVAENRMPCRNDDYIDVDSLLGGVNRGTSKELSIELLDCGRFVVTIHKPIDGVPNGQLLFVASPGDADAGKPLEWQCFSAHHKRIERHTNGGCTYDPSVAVISSRPDGEQSVTATVERPSKPPATATVEQRSKTSAPATVEQPSKTTANRNPNIQFYLDRLAEPALWEDCGSGVTSYRLLRFNADQYVAAVRISHDTEEGAYRTATSSSPKMTRALDGYENDRTWARIEASFDAAGFWNLQSKRHVGRADGPRIYLEACKNGNYYAVERRPDDPELAAIVRGITGVGRLEWLEGG